MWELIAAAIAVAGSIASTVYNNKANRSLIDSQQNWNEDMMDKQNDWNSDAERIARAESAGINPMSLYMGDGSSHFGLPSAGVNPSSLIPSQDILGGASTSLVSLSQSLLNGANTKTENALRLARLQGVENQNKLWLSELDGMNLDNQTKQIALKYTDMMYQWELKGRKMDYRLHGRELARMNKEIETMSFNLEKILPEEFQKIISERKINVLELEHLTGVIKNLEADTRYKIAETGLSEAQTPLVKGQADYQEKVNQYYDRLTEEIISKYEAEIKSISAKTKLDEEEVYWQVFDRIKQNTATFFGSPSSVSRDTQKSYQRHVNRRLQEIE